MVLMTVKGCGKTAAVETISSELDISVSQWGSQSANFIPLDERGDNSINYESQTSLFDSFLLRATKYVFMVLRTISMQPSLVKASRKVQTLLRRVATPCYRLITRCLNFMQNSLKP